MVGIAIIIGFVFGVVKLLAWGYNQILSIDPIISVALITGVLTVTGTTLSITIPQYLKKRIEIEQHLRIKKSENYMEELLIFITY
ncbi:hypothetical protein FZC74_00145 [Sutcliffiella horikoshii]|uniref:Uncharacterized protein n=1 Tax=Sutcliffiella horikoshii TaxID=79883 RepID=A0AA94WQ47_9BACI|nr:hypothetical protein [Sutcliffiella horikoshii]TYS60749.1 hypothetical protein FZC74_00145 [Sutcliffiella horikoshii]